MMKMAQPMERGTLANPRINRQNFGKGLKVGVLQLQVLASALSLSIPAVPVWSKISNALKRLGFRSRNFLLKSMYNSGSTIKFREALE